MINKKNYYKDDDYLRIVRNIYKIMRIRKMGWKTMATAFGNTQTNIQQKLDEQGVKGWRGIDLIDIIKFAKILNVREACLFFDFDDMSDKDIEETINDWTRLSERYSPMQKKQIFVLGVKSYKMFRQEFDLEDDIPELDDEQSKTQELSLIPFRNPSQKSK